MSAFIFRKLIICAFEMFVKQTRPFLFLHAALALFDELLGHAGAAAAGADGEGLRLDEELVHRHLDVMLASLDFNNLLIFKVNY